MVASLSGPDLKSTVDKVEVVKYIRLDKVNEYHGVNFHSKKDINLTI